MSEADVTEALNSWLSLPAGMDVVTSVNMKAHRTLIERARDEIVALQNLLGAAAHALRSYQYHNASPDLAEEVANWIERALKGGKQ